MPVDGRKQVSMTSDRGGVSRRSFLRRATAVSLGALATRGIYQVLEELDVVAPARAWAAPATRPQEQYLVGNIQVITDNGVKVAIPPLYNDVITAKLKSSKKWTTSALKTAQIRLENALATVERAFPATAAGLTIVMGWGLPFFRSFLPSSLWQANLPVDQALSQQAGSTQYAVLDAIGFPSDPADLLLEDNHVMFKFRSDSQAILSSVEGALLTNQNSGAFVGDLFDLTSQRVGFLGRGFGTPSIAKQLALKAGVQGADQIPDDSQLMLGFTSTQTAGLGPDKIVSFETLPGVTNQWPNGYFANGCAMHLSHLFEDLSLWYKSFDYAGRVARMFSPHTTVPTDPGTVTLSNGPGDVATLDQVKQDATGGVLGHNETLQQASRLPADVVDNYGRLRPAGTAVPLREDFNTLDNPFKWTANSSRDRFSSTAAPGLHFAVFVPASGKFHTARLAMDGVLPDGTNLRAEPYNIPDSANGINAMIRASHRQNFLIPPRRHRSFPLVELLK
jgi:hypothetical protein